uniref:Bromo domain-containing protein n=1 Tax=Heterorhabditis bacteriophora TaxID=37862 RepID=A0A1I7WT84_HETBA
MSVGDCQMPGTSHAPDEQTNFELLLLIERFLANGPCRRAAAVLRRDIEDNQVALKNPLYISRHIINVLKLVPNRHDFNGNQHVQKYLDIVSGLPRSTPSLMDMVSRLSVLSDLTIPPAIRSLPLRLINNKRNCLTRTTGKFLSYLRYCVADADCKYMAIMLDSIRFMSTLTISKYVRLEVSVDKSIRVWSLQTGETVQVFKCHTAVVARVKFLPFVNDMSRYLVSCAFDCQVVFYKFDENTMEFGDLTRFFERDTPGARIISLCHSASGQWVVVGDSHCYLRVFRITPEHGVRKMCDINAHTDRVDSLEWAHAGLRFASGSRDGVAKVWKFSCGQWKSVPLQLQGGELQNAIQSAPTTTSERSKSKYRVTMLCWTLNDSLVITAGSDHVLRTWNPSTGDMLMKLPGHTDDAFVLQAHPVHPEIVLSCGHDGVLAIWDILSGRILRKFTNGVEHRGHSALFDLDVSRDGCSMAAVDSLGHVLIFGLGSNQAAKSVPKQQFFHTDYTPLIQDDSGWVLDESTGLAPHLMPPAHLTDQDLLAHDAEWQRYVPGRDGIKVDNEPAICVWLNRSVIPPLPLSERKNKADEMEVITAAETLEYNEEISREPEPEVEVIVQTVGERRKSEYYIRNAWCIFLCEHIILIYCFCFSDTASSSAPEGTESDTSDTDFSVGGRNRERERRRELVETEPEVTTTSSGRRVQRRMRTVESFSIENQPIRRELARRRVVVDGESSPQEDGIEEDEINRPSASSDRRRRNRLEEPFVETAQSTDAANVERRKKERKKKVSVVWILKERLFLLYLEFCYSNINKILLIPGDEATEADHVSFADCPPLDEDWIGSDVYGVLEARAISSRRLLNSIDSLRGLETVAPFATAVNLEEFPNYAMNIDYPIDLEKISERIRCGFYRRLRSLHQDIRCIAVAAEQFNEPDSVIVRNARVLVEALILFSHYDSLFDVPPEEIVEYRRRQWTRIDADLLNMAASQSSVEQSVPRPGWVRDCKGILQLVMRDPCAAHFLKADTADEVFELAAALEQSCDLSSLVDMLDRGEMSTPHEVAQRVEQMVHACRNCIDDKRNPFERIWNNLDLGGRELRKRQKRERHKAYNTRSCDNQQTSRCLPSTSQQSEQSTNNSYHSRDVNTERSMQYLEIQAPPVQSTSGERRTQSRKALLSVQSYMQPSSVDSSPVRPPALRSRGRPRGNEESQRREAALELQELIEDIEENMSEQYCASVELQDVSEDDSGRSHRKNGRKRRDISEVSRASNFYSTERPSRYSTRSTNNISKRRRIGSSDDEVQSSRRVISRDSLVRRRTTNTVNYAESDDEEQIESHVYL